MCIYYKKMPRQNPVPQELLDINQHTVNNNHEYREQFLTIIEKMSGMIFDLKEKVKDSEYKELYEMLSELYEFKNELGMSIIFQVIQHKHKLNRQAKKPARTEEEKLAQGYKRCKRCDALLKNQNSLNNHIKRNICKKVFVIKETSKITAKEQGASLVSVSKLIHKKNVFTYMTSYIDRHIQYQQFWIEPWDEDPVGSSNWKDIDETFNEYMDETTELEENQPVEDEYEDLDTTEKHHKRQKCAWLCRHRAWIEENYEY